VWKLAGERAPDAAASAASPLVIDVDATLVTAHSDKESAAPTYKRGRGYPSKRRSPGQVFSTGGSLAGAPG
jgi:hypothetical protein